MGATDVGFDRRREERGRRSLGGSVLGGGWRGRLSGAGEERQRVQLGGRESFVLDTRS